MDENTSKALEDGAVEPRAAGLRTSDARIPLTKRVEGINVLDLADPPPFQQLIASRKMLLMLLLLALKDRATELHFGPVAIENGASRDLSMSYKVDDTFFELVPAPALLAPKLLHEIRTISGLTSIRAHLTVFLYRLRSKLGALPRAPLTGRFEIRDSAHRAQVSVAVSAKRPDRMSLHFLGTRSDLPERAAAELHRIMSIRKAKRLSTSSADPDVAPAEAQP